MKKKRLRKEKLLPTVDKDDILKNEKLVEKSEISPKENKDQILKSEKSEKNSRLLQNHAYEWARIYLGTDNTWILLVPKQLKKLAEQSDLLPSYFSFRY